MTVIVPLSLAIFAGVTLYIGLVRPVFVRAGLV
jgi:invasion protein IalB